MVNKMVAMCFGMQQPAAPINAETTPLDQTDKKVVATSGKATASELKRAYGQDEQYKEQL